MRIAFLIIITLGDFLNIIQADVRTSLQVVSHCIVLNPVSESRMKSMVEFIMAWFGCLEFYVLATSKVISGRYRLVTVHNHGDYIGVTIWEIILPGP